MIKIIHLSAVSLSFIGFFIRGLWMMADSSMLAKKWVKVVPHIVDTVLLLSAIMLTIQIQQFPFVTDWLTAKFCALMVYIFLGIIALRAGKTKQQKVIAWLLGLATFVYIGSVAMTKTPMPF